MHGAIPVIAACIRTGVLTIYSRVIPTGGSMQTLIGSPALSEFKTQRLLSALTKENPEITGVSAFYCHFIDVAEDLTDEQKNQLERLLTYGPRMQSQEAKGQLALVLPRIGTISPWSSKATDIAHICGLTKIKRIERVLPNTCKAPSGPTTSRDTSMTA